MIRRALERDLETALARFPVVGLVGSRQVGKTTLARSLAASGPQARTLYLDLELPSDLARLQDPEILFVEHADRMVVIDEIQRRPDLFPVIRAIVDQDRRPGRFLVLGSASPDLLRQSSESLAGRIVFLELTPFRLEEVASPDTDPESVRTLWVRGGYPESFLAGSDEESLAWRDAFLRTFLERDVPQLAVRAPAERMRRLWEMLAHLQGQLLNASALARSLDVSYHTVHDHLDVLSATFMLRQLRPFAKNLKKRLVKSPKVYIRDSGLLHALLHISRHESLESHPVLGSSFEGFAIEQILSALPASVEATFFRAHTGEELDLVLRTPRDSFIGIEIKRTFAPRVGPGTYRALELIDAKRGFVVTAGREEFPLGPNLRAVPLPDFVRSLGERLAE